MMRMMGNMPEGISPSELPEPDSPGARLVARYGGQCHGVSTPKRLAAEEWRPTLRRVLVRMERMERIDGDVRNPPRKRVRMSSGSPSAARGRTMRRGGPGGAAWSGAGSAYEYEYEIPGVREHAAWALEVAR